jgi:UDP-N-acetylmuramate dehydrogenase
MRFSDLTTLGVGGEIADFVEATTTPDIVSAALDARERGIPLLVLGGGSNILISEEGFDGRVIAVRNRGIDSRNDESADSTVRVRVAAGEDWDAFVAWTVENGYAGLEALSGIPGRVGAAPIQNIGAYGQEVAEVLRGVDILDLRTGDVRYVGRDDLELSYRDSIFKHDLEAIVLSADFDLQDARADRLSTPVAFEQLASALDVELGDRVALAGVRDAVLGLRRSKGMVLDPSDADTRSAGSFFVNPVVTERFARTLPPNAPRFLLAEEAGDRVLEIGAEVPPLAGPSLVKLSAAWLIENAGVPKGFALPGARAAVSSKHTLALTNRGGATADEVAALARYVRSMVQSQFGILLQPEPVCVGVDL